MGETQSTEETSTFSNTLTFVDTATDECFGLIDIYKTKEAPYEYLMDFKKNFI